MSNTALPPSESSPSTLVTGAVLGSITSKQLPKACLHVKNVGALNIGERWCTPRRKKCFIRASLKYTSDVRTGLL